MNRGDRITLSYPTENSEQIMETNDKGEVTDWYYTNTKEKEYQVMAVIEPLPNSMNMHMFFCKCSHSSGSSGRCEGVRQWDPVCQKL